jgi:hypothetical protein
MSKRVCEPPPAAVTAAAYRVDLPQAKAVIRALGWPRDRRGYFLDTTFGRPWVRIDDWETVHFWYRQTDQYRRRAAACARRRPTRWGRRRGRGLT